jgi:uncharacterized protein (TIGR03118 family)
MLKRLRSPRSLALIVAATSGLALAAPTAAFASTGHHQAPQHKSHQQDHRGHGHGQEQHSDLALHQVNLASDIPGMAKLTDPDLKNPWGLSMAPTSPLWVSNQGTDSSTLFSLPPGTDSIAKNPAIRVTLPGSVAGPSGQVANTGTGFVLNNGTVSAPAAFIFATLDGHIEAWNPTVDPHIGNTEDKVTVPGAAYTGLALAKGAHGDRLYAANFAQGGVDVFDSSFKQVKTASWQFRDAHLPKGYLPFNTQTLNGNVFVTYDKTDAKTGREAVGKGLGVIDEYTPDGRFVARIASGGALNAPWGLAIAPPSWGRAAGSLLVGNFGDGRINIIDGHNGRFENHIQGQVHNKSTGKPFAEPGLWALLPGTAMNGGTDAVWFSAGINGEQNGLLGVLRP